MIHTIARVPAHALRLEGPLPAIAVGDALPHFREHPPAQDQYEGHRSPEAPDNTNTFHLLSGGEVAGFISWRVGIEDLPESRSIFVSIDFIYLKRAFRGRKLSSMLLPPLIDEVQSQLIRAICIRTGTDIRIYSASSTNSRTGDFVLHAVERRLADVVRSRPGARLIGKHLEYPPRPPKRSEATFEPAALAEVRP